MASIIVHLTALLLIVLLPKLPYFKRLAAERAQAQALKMAPQPPLPRFVFVQPRAELAPRRPPPPNAPLADLDRNAMTYQKAPNPKNPQPFSRGNSPEFVEKSPPPRPPSMAQQPGPPNQQPPQNSPSQTASNSAVEDALRLLKGGMTNPSATHQGAAPRPPATGIFSEANTARYTERAVFENPNGGQNSDFGPSIQFDTKGVEFGPWIRRFLAQLKRNWLPLIPQTAMSLRGHVAISFNVLRNGAITDLRIVGPSSIESFNNAAYGGLVATSPTEPLPAAYPSEKCFITVTFFYNERLPEGP